MTPIEILRGEIDPEKLKNSYVYGIIYRAEKKTPPSLQERLKEILTSNDPGGFYRTSPTQDRWLEKRQTLRNEHGDDALILLLPENGHHGYARLYNLLSYHGIVTISQLLEEKEKVLELWGASSKKAEALKVIFKHLESPQVKKEK